MKSKEEVNIIRDGYIEPIITEDNFIFGDAQAPQEVLQEGGQWDKFLPENEKQLIQFETTNCTAFNTTNPLEIILRRKGIEHNYSDRFLGVIAGTKPPGNDPHTVAEALRKKGIVKESSLPFSADLKDWQEYFSYKGADEKELIKESEKWFRDFFFRHDYVAPNDNEIPKDSLKEALKHSPLGIAVLAWASRDGIYFRPPGQGDSHWTTLIGYKEGEYWLVLDSYEPFLKKLEWNFPFYTAKRYYLREKTVEEKKIEAEQFSLFQSIINLIALQIQRISEQVQALLNPKKEEPKKEPKEEPKKSLLIEFAKAISAYEDAPEYWNNPGAIKSKDGKFLMFKTYQAGFDYLLDYIRRVAKDEHRAYPKGGETSILEYFHIYSPVSDNNNSTAYAQWVAKRIGVTTGTKIKDIV